MMLFFKDLNFGQESALFICKEKDDKDAKADVDCSSAYNWKIFGEIGP